MSLPAKRVPSPERSVAEDAPGLPGVGTWRGVYTLVLAVFAVVVLLLVWFGSHFS